MNFTVKNIAWLGVVVVLFAAIIRVGIDAREAQKKTRELVTEFINKSAGDSFASVPTVLYFGQACPIIEHVLLRIKNRLATTKARIPALSEVENARIENCRLRYSMGTATTNKGDPPHLYPPDACLLEIGTRYRSKYDNSMQAKLVPTKTYDLGSDCFEYTVWLITAPSCTDEIHRIIEQEMDIAAKQLQKAQMSADSLWPFW